ncbi:MAG: endopeptidase La, partial [bacterium]
LKIDDPVRFSDLVAYHLSIPLEKKQGLLEIDSVQRLSVIGKIIKEENQIAKIEKEFDSKIKEEIEKKQKEYYLSERMRLIQNELKEKGHNEEDKLYHRIEQASLPKEVLKRAKAEFNRFKYMSQGMAEREVLRNYLNWIICLPWNKKDEERINLKEAKEILNNSHWGLLEVKERVLEFLAVRKLRGKTSGSSLCFTGPPGTGKTSAAHSIAKALNRKFVRASLGGLRDEAEIKGHRYTYVAAMPGIIIQLIRKAGTRNPVLLLDEIDKSSFNITGCLLDLLDVNCNKAFFDNYIDLPFDLSEVIFITTANSDAGIPNPLLDRMEVIEFPSYTIEEKFHIAKNFLIPSGIREQGLNGNLSFSNNAIKEIISSYTREAGVRGLARCLAKVLRKGAKEIVFKNKKTRIQASNLKKYLGYPLYKKMIAPANDDIGASYSLAWTENGGEILTTEALCIPGSGNLYLTGRLGKIIKEQAYAGLSYIRKKAKDLSLSEDFYKNTDIHIHLPWGAVEKDGPSAGVSIVLSMISSLLKKPFNKTFAVTGEITLSGKILPVFGCYEKVLAAHRAGISKVLLPKENKVDILSLPLEVKKETEIVLVSNIDEVISYVF